MTTFKLNRRSTTHILADSREKFHVEEDTSEILKVRNEKSRESPPTAWKISIWTCSDNSVESLTKIRKQMSQRIENRHETCRRSMNK